MEELEIKTMKDEFENGFQGRGNLSRKFRIDFRKPNFFLIWAARKAPICRGRG